MPEPTPLSTHGPFIDVARPDVAEQFDAGRWEFTPGVAAVFDEHVRASVPHYEIVQEMVAHLSDWLLPQRALICDLGASTGYTVDLLLNRHPERELSAVLYDEAPAMLAKAAEKLGPAIAAGRVEMRPQRVQDPLKHSAADLTLALFLLQFLPYADRPSVLRAARDASAPTGALLIAEKLRPVDARWSEIAYAVSHDWKAEHGIDAAAIRAKERSLRGVLQPVSLTALNRMVTDAGWHAPEVLFRWHQWVLIGAFACAPDGWA